MKQANDKDTKLRRRMVFVLGITIAVACFFTYRQLLVAPNYSGGSLSVTEAYKKAKSGAVILVDIRRPDEWELTGIAGGAHPIDMRRKDFLADLAVVAGPGKSREIALICARGVRSARLSKQLTKAGYTSIINVPEGMLGSGAGPGWLANDLPTVLYIEPSG